MKLSISAGYSDLFNEEKPTMESLLEDIPSELVISILSKLNAELYLREDQSDTQIRIFRFLLQRQPKEVVDGIFANLFAKTRRNPNEPVHFFTTVANLEFIHYELINYRTTDREDTTPEEELKFLKAYFIVAEDVNNKYINAFDKNKDDQADYFASSTWPTLFDQFEVNHKSDPMIAMIRGLAFLNYLQYHSEFANYVKRFLTIHNKATSWNYIMDIMNLLKSCWGKFSLNKENISFSLNSVDGFIEQFSQYEMNVEEYKEKYTTEKKNFNGLKSKPLLKMPSGTYIVLDWNLLTGKLYEGLLFDFYSTSGINQEPQFKNLPDFKRYVGKEITEGHVFTKLLKSILERKHTVLHFDQNETPSFPDCYYRDGNKVALFELKDAYFASRAINSFSYQDIRAEIDKKCNTDYKGTGQIIKQLTYLSQNSFEAPKKYKYPRNLVIYPILVYTDIFFGCPGVDAYLIAAFKQRLTVCEASKSFKKIQDLTCIPLSFFIKHIHLLKERKLNLFDLVECYHKILRAHHKKFTKDKGDMDAFFAMYDSFQTQLNNKFPDILKKDERFVRTIMEVLALTEGLFKK